MSATEQMRAMLDGLMGTARDGSDSKRQHLHFTDSRVCRAFLLDCCPHDIFSSTKLELGECPKVHDPALRADYIIANKSNDYMYEVYALERLRAFVYEADKKTDYLKRKLAETQEELTAEETSKLNRVHDVTEKLGKKLAQVDKAEADGDLELKQKYLDEAERIKKERAAAEAEYRQVSRPASSHQQQNLRVCDICSAYLGINDNDSRLADHFGGKLHLGFITVREKLEDLKKIVGDKRSSIVKDDRERGRSRDYERYGRSLDYDRDRGYRDRERDRNVRDRYYDREPRDTRDRERDRSRSSEYYDRNSGYRYHSGYYRNEQRDNRPRDRYRDERSERYDAPVTNRSGGRGAFERVEHQEQETMYQRKLRELEKREVDQAKRRHIRDIENRDRKQLEEQESKKLKEFLEDYKDDRDDIRFYRGSALIKRQSDRQRELEHDELNRQKEKMELEMLSRSCVVKSSPKPIECANEIEPAPPATPNQADTMPVAPENNNSAKQNPPNTNNHASTTSSNTTANQQKSLKDKKNELVKAIVESIPTQKDQLFASKIDWSLLDENLMERRVRPWISKKIAGYLGENEVDLIDFVCTLVNAQTDASSMLREVAVVLDDEAEKFVFNMWRLLIFETEAKKQGIRR